MKERLDQLTAQHGPEEKFQIVGYSRGAIQLNKASLKMKPAEQKRILAVGLCPGAILLPSQFLSAKNILNDDPRKDIVPYTDYFGWRISNEQFPSLEHIVFCKSDPDVKEESYHSFDSPTLQRDLRETLNRNIHNHMRRT